MKFILSISLLLCSSLLFAQSKTPGPKEEAVAPFLPELFSQFPNVRDLTISPDGNQMYFTLQSYRRGQVFIVGMHKEEGKWRKPEVAPFSGRYNDVEPAFAPDGLKLFFCSNRPLSDTIQEPKDVDIWYVERKDFDSPWSKPVNIGAPINTANNEYYPSLTTSGKLYYTAQRDDSKGGEDIYVSQWQQGSYTTPVSLPQTINSELGEFNAFIAPDDSYLIFSSYGRKDDLGNGDLYISFRDREGKWSPAKNLGSSINTKEIEYCPFVDTKTQTLYFTSSRNKIPKFFDQAQNLEQILKCMNQCENGLNRLYRVSVRKLLKDNKQP
ncbi:MAG: hypothetical protein ACEPOZ_03405 [Marinifilaceae bacterium]